LQYHQLATSLLVLVSSLNEERHGENDMQVIVTPRDTLQALPDDTNRRITPTQTEYETQGRSWGGLHREFGVCRGHLTKRGLLIEQKR